MKEIGIMEVGGFQVGHAQNEAAGTGCTVILLDEMSPAGLDVRGGGPASRESQLLSPLAAAEGVNALGVIVTNANLHKAQLCKVAGMAHNGYARAIHPVHTTADGDSIYAVSTGGEKGDVNMVGTLAAHAMERAILRAVRAAKSAYGLKGLGQ